MEGMLCSAVMKMSSNGTDDNDGIEIVAKCEKSRDIVPPGVCDGKSNGKSNGKRSGVLGGVCERSCCINSGRIVDIDREPFVFVGMDMVIGTDE